MKITEKVSFNIASEASKVCILSRQKLIKNAKIQTNIFGGFQTLCIMVFDNFQKCLIS